MTELFITLAILGTLFLAVVGPGVVRKHIAWKKRRFVFVRIIPNIAAFSAALTAMGDTTAQAAKAFGGFREAFEAAEATKEASK